MNKTKSLVLQCIGIFIVFAFIYWWAGREYRKTHPVQEWKAIENTDQVKVYQGKWHKDFLEVIR